MHLLGLPGELSLMILECLESEQDINAFARTHSHFYTHFNTYLYTRNMVASQSSAIIWAASHGIPETLQKSIQQGGNIEVRDALRDNTPLAIAIEHGHTAIANQLLDQGADISARNKYQQTPLFEVARLGDESLARRLIDLGAEVDATDENWKSPLRYALYEKHSSVVEVLLQRGADPNHRGSITNIKPMPPLYIAIVNLDETSVRLLLEYRADPEMPGHFPQPLHMAARKGHVYAARLLLERGVDRTRKDPSGRTPMDLAEWAGLGDRMRPLLE
ncbi:unnamed protein product [Penicillium salamii]|uniref:Ankyrin repeat-containing domain protein n=1 Tax=Penicillium salamii TaxID=1612424 RepID=A0A9W4I533_9EURO|nr:unnamed protein product [Penicillium salamii]